MAKRFKYATALQPETQGGAASIVMAVISVVLFVAAVVVSFVFNGSAGNYIGVIGLVAVLMSVCGFFIGLRSFSVKERSHRFSTIGAMANGIISVGWLALFLIGV